MAEIKAEAGPTLLPRGRWVRLNPPGNRTGDGMRIIALCLRLAVKTAFAFCGLIGIVEEAAAEGPGSIIRVWPLEGGGPAVDWPQRRAHRGLRRHSFPLQSRAGGRPPRDRLGPSDQRRGDGLRPHSHARQ